MNKINEEEIVISAKLGNTSFGRVLSSVYQNGALWTTAQMEQKERKSKIVVIRKDEHISSSVMLESTGSFHQPSIIPQGNEGMALFWNEIDKDTWKIRYAFLNEKPLAVDGSDTIFSSSNLCLPPTATCWDDKLWVAWAGIEAGSMRIHVAQKKGHTWHIIGPVSKEGIDAFRPYLASNDEGVFLAWDQYKGNTYEIVFSRFDGLNWQPVKTLSRDNERWFCSKLVASEKGVIYLSWVVLQTVSDPELGIVDNFPFATVASFADGNLEYLLDKTNACDHRIVADFREGLLASQGCGWKGYMGLRRNPFLSLSQKGELWCLWEVHMEEEKSRYSGYLVGRKLNDDRTWTSPFILHSNGYCYSVPVRFTSDKIPVVFFKLKPKKIGLDVIEHDLVDPTKSIPYQINNARWQRWNSVNIKSLSKSKRKIKNRNKEYSLFWADTHCHSVFSFDAEGEVDELIHWAKDVAELDAVCIVDNDFYTHKALTEAEWQIHQQFSTHFTQEGEFVVFPGWEYTYHRKDLDPPHNHRVIFYPRAGEEFFRRIDSATDSDKKLFTKLRGKNVVCYPHHCTYQLIVPDVDRNVEVCSSWRVCMEEADFTLNLLKSGKKFGFIGSSDSHRAVPGLGGAITGLFSKELTPEALFDAYRHRRTIATQGFFIFIDFWVGGIFIGGEGEAPAHPDVEAFVQAPREIEVIEVLRDGYTIYRQTVHKSEFSCSFTDDTAEQGEHFYFLKAKLVGDPSFSIDPAENSYIPHSTDVLRYPYNLARARGAFAWTSPVWLTIK